MNPFKGRHFQRDIIPVGCMPWYATRVNQHIAELQEMLAERGVNVDHSTIYRWVQRYAPEMEKRLRWKISWRNLPDLARSTWTKPYEGQWPLGRHSPGSVVDSRGRTRFDFYLSRRNSIKPLPGFCKTSTT